MRLTVQDAAALLGVSEKTIYRWINRGTLPAYRVSDQYRFNRAELLAWAISRRLNVSEDLFSDALRVAGPIPRLTEAVRGGGIVYRLEGGTKQEALQHLADSVRLPVEMDRGYLLRLLLARESLGSTGVGEGVAIPQLLYPNTLEPAPPVVILAFLEQPVDYQALDGLPVDCLVGLISPSLRGYYFLLDRIHYALRDAGVRQVLKGRPSRDQIVAELSRVESGLCEALS